MTVYLDVAAVRIQQYLARSPSLRGRRAASAVLAEATRLGENAGASDSPTLKAMDGKATLNHEAGVVDGVIHLVLNDGVAAQEVALGVLSVLRNRLPGAEFHAVWGAGESYVDAYVAQIADKLDRGEVLADFPPMAEFPLAAPCQICRTASAVGRVQPGPEDEWRDACADCLMRHSGPANHLGRSAEGRLLEELGFSAARRVKGFEELADYGTGRTQLATIYADGNALGEFFERLAQQPATDMSRKISGEITAATWLALTEAARQVQQGFPAKGPLCVVPHLVGGDDLLVTVPADRGWRFTRTFLAEFGALMEGSADLAGVTPAPTASAGLVFHHKTEPFADVVEAAAQALRAAKNEVGGRSASIGFHDLTEDGPQRPKQSVVRLSTLEKAESWLNELAGMPASRRENLAAFTRDGHEGRRAAVFRLRRLGHDALAHAVEEDRALMTVLRIARWWQK